MSNEIQHHILFKMCPICGETEIEVTTSIAMSREDEHVIHCPNCGHDIVVKIKRHE